MTPPTGTHRPHLTIVSGARAPSSGAQGTVQGYKTKTKTREGQENDIHPQKQLTIFTRIRIIREYWQGWPEFLKGLAILLWLHLRR
jgi:hypothetical protein